MADMDVPIDESGEIGPAHQFVQAVDGETGVMDSGCLCCVIRSDLAHAVPMMNCSDAADI